MVVRSDLETSQLDEREERQRPITGSVLSYRSTSSVYVGQPHIVLGRTNICHD